ncbi:MAG: rhodanese-like domain-containing protein [Demequinaceae bacterium]|nr:rhodanese-like domain-containing protein [Demequinaceae bacterium]
MLKNTPSATLVDIRNEAEWRYLGVPDLGDIGGRVEFIECTTYPDGVPNPNFIDQLAAAGLTSSAGVPVLFICRAGHRSVDAAIAATMAGLGPCYNVLDGFEGELGEDGHRGHAGWRAVGLPWYQQ